MISTPKIARIGLLVALFCFGAALSIAFSLFTDKDEQRGAARKQSDQFSNIILYTQHGQPVRFYDDLVKDKTVIINLMFTGCGETCPANTAELAKINDLLGQRMGRDIIMVSLSIDPVADSPARLKQYWESFGAKPGWLFLTGKPGEVDRLRREIGAYDLDPQIDADPTQHAGFITVGNDRTNRWTALPLLMHRRQLVGTILRISRNG
ncbi:MAG: SCO family protein [Betaproteobacteria bacterium]|nr:SCO family protein [Betaproteobacteria bacterium]